jgi:hypothetical protein
MGFGISDLSPTYVGSGLYPTLDRGIVQVAMPMQVARNLFGYDSLVGKGNAKTYPKESASVRVGIARVGEKAKIGFISHPYSYVVAKPYKIGAAIGISHEVIEDADLPVMVNQMTRAGLLFGNQMDADGILSLLANTAGDKNVCGKTKIYTGAEVTKANTIGQYDLVNAKTLLMHYNYNADLGGGALVMAPSAAAWVRVLPTYADNEAYGAPVYKEGVWAGAQLPQHFGTVEGLRCYITNNMVTAPFGSGALTMKAIVAATGGANPLGQYSPIGFFVDKRPMTTRPEEDNSRDMTKTFLTARYYWAIVNNKPYVTLADMGTQTDGTAPLS